VLNEFRKDRAELPFLMHVAVTKERKGHGGFGEGACGRAIRWRRGTTRCAKTQSIPGYSHRSRRRHAMRILPSWGEMGRGYGAAGSAKDLTIPIQTADGGGHAQPILSDRTVGKAFTPPIQPVSCERHIQGARRCQREWHFNRLSIGPGLGK